MIIEVNNLVKRYKDLVALDHFNLQVNKGEIYGLLGPCLLYTSPFYGRGTGCS